MTRRQRNDKDKIEYLEIEKKELKEQITTLFENEKKLLRDCTALEDKVEKLQDKIEYEQSINDQKQSEINLKYREIIELQKQIDKMKCCENCAEHSRIDGECHRSGGKCANGNEWRMRK